MYILRVSPHLPSEKFCVHTWYRMLVYGEGLIFLHSWIKILNMFPFNVFLSKVVEVYFFNEEIVLKAYYAMRLFLIYFFTYIF
jgi:hypothetical protein